MTAPRCSQCKWQLDPGERHGTLQCFVRSAAQVEASRVTDSLKAGRAAGVDARSFRRALRDVVALEVAS